MSPTPSLLSLNARVGALLQRQPVGVVVAKGPRAGLPRLVVRLEQLIGDLGGVPHVVPRVRHVQDDGVVGLARLHLRHLACGVEGPRAVGAVGVVLARQAAHRVVLQAGGLIERIGETGQPVCVVVLVTGHSGVRVGHRCAAAHCIPSVADGLAAGNGRCHAERAPERVIGPGGVLRVRRDRC